MVMKMTLKSSVHVCVNHFFSLLAQSCAYVLYWPFKIYNVSKDNAFPH